MHMFEIEKKWRMSISSLQDNESIYKRLIETLDHHAVWDVSSYNSERIIKQHIEQYCLLMDADKLVRIRRSYSDPGDPAPLQQYTMTVKCNTSASPIKRIELNTKLDDNMGAQLIERCSSIGVRKTRYVIPYLNPYKSGESMVMNRISHIYIDIYHDKLEGLVLVEVEFENMNESASFDWKDVIPNINNSQTRLILDAIYSKGCLTECTNSPSYKFVNLGRSILKKLWTGEYIVCPE